MFKHYITVAFRNFFRNKIYSFINILGLAVGMGACILIYQYVHFEMSYDKFHTNAQNTYRVTQDVLRNGETIRTGVFTPHALGVASKITIPEIEQYLRVRPLNEGLVITNLDKDVVLLEDEIWYVDDNFLEVFDFPLKYGERKSALNGKYDIVITEQIATKYYGDINPIGKELKVTGGVFSGEFVVKAVLQDLPENSHLQFDFLMPMNFMLGQWGPYQVSNGWELEDFVTYLTINKSANPKVITEKLNQIILSHNDETGAMEDVLKLELQSMTDIHLKSNFSREMATNNGDIKEMNFYTLIALFIVIIAWVNYINLSTAHAMKRAKEVGVRKSIGVLKSQLISQFLTESVLINLLATGLAVLFAFLTLPLLNDVIGKTIELNIFQELTFWISLASVVIFGSLLSGLYPAFVLSSFRPIGIVQSVKSTQKGGLSLRQGLIVFQFMMSALLISGTYLVFEQISFMKSKDLGVDMEQILIIDGPRIILTNERSVMESKYQAFKSSSGGHHAISAITGTSSVPGKGHVWSDGIRKLGEPVNTNRVGDFLLADANFTDTYDFDFIQGAGFKKELSAITGVIINREAVDVYNLGSPEAAMREQLITNDGDTLKIIGVVENVHWTSLKGEHRPLLFMHENLYNAFFSVKVNLNDVEGAIGYIKSSYQLNFPDDPFEYYFLDDDFNNQYQSDLQFGKLFSTFSIFAIFISCLGLFALVSFSATLRIKEIGVRKVLGARISHLMILLSQEYLKLLLLANALAVPLAMYWGSSWLDNYAFKVTMGIDTFLIPGLLLIVISVLTVSYRTYVAACANPAESLRSE